MSRLLLHDFHFVPRDQETGEPQLSDWFNPKKRPDVITTTNWLAPVIWEGTYNRPVLQKYYKRLNITIGLAVICVPRKFSNQSLTDFIQSANKHFLFGYSVVFYFLLDIFSTLPPIALGPLRTFKVFLMVKSDTGKDFYFIYMNNFFDYIITHIQYEVNFLFVMNADQVFKDDFGVETLGKSVAQLSAWWYFKDGDTFPYERRLKSAAFIPFEEGDFYYHSAIFGGTVEEVLNLIREYQKGAIQDIKNQLSSTYEHHLNKYLFIKKPTKLLSPEYNWDPSFRTPPQIKCVKIAWQSKNQDLPGKVHLGPAGSINRIKQEPWGCQAGTVNQKGTLQALEPKPKKEDPKVKDTHKQVNVSPKTQDSVVSAKEGKKKPKAEPLIQSGADGDVFKAQTPNQETQGALEVREAPDVHVEVPVEEGWAFGGAAKGKSTEQMPSWVLRNLCGKKGGFRLCPYECQEVTGLHELFAAWKDCDAG
ncbi:N-acetyllactosaminide alpha-1,3-galactosyltransferase-like 1 [Dama dama]|uniref:N-acetyllactosaminide alpha-1,3-galactosyltransferase-like 1 n=1 Tax=Dama dama TaxID=30532 RepID=UPI002A359964|nr:N-acetyllactosaminide alpha-1,3-galactosyltransferase-like 1 [Dama dama]